MEVSQERFKEVIQPEIEEGKAEVLGPNHLFISNRASREAWDLGCDLTDESHQTTGDEWTGITFIIRQFGDLSDLFSVPEAHAS